MKKIGLIVMMSLLLWTCKDDDPKLDLSQKISFLWDIYANPDVHLYVVVSDTSGNILEWGEIEDNKLLELGYPPDPNLVTLSVIKTSTSGSSTPFTYVDVMSYTGIAGKQYNYTDQPYVSPDLPDRGYFKFSIDNRVDFAFVSNYAGGDYTYYDNYEMTGTIETYTYGLYNNKPTNLLVVAKLPYPNDTETRYAYSEDVQDGDSTGISSENFYDLTPSDLHVVNYTDHQDMNSTWASIYGVPENTNYGLSLDYAYWSSNQVPKLSYTEFPGLFSQYQTEVFANEDHASHYVRHVSATPNLNFQNLNASIDKVTEASTKRIALNTSGDADIILSSLSFGVTNQYNIAYYVYAPMGPKVRMALPQFSQDLIEEIPLLAEIGEREFNVVYTDEYNMSNQEFFASRMTNGLYVYPTEMRSNGFSASTGSGRLSIDERAIVKVHSNNPRSKDVK